MSASKGSAFAAVMKQMSASKGAAFITLMRIPGAEVRQEVK